MALKFNGTTEYLQFDFVDSLTLPLSICFFGYKTATASGDNCHVYFHNNSIGAPMNVSGCRLSGAGDTCSIDEDSSTQAARTASAPTGTYAINRWMFCATTSRGDGLNRIAYLNGNGGTANTGDCDPTGLRYLDIGRGRDFGGLFYTAHRIGHVAAWNAELTSSEVAMLYNSGIPLDPRNIRTDSLIGFWPLRSDLLDYSGNGHHMAIAAGSPIWTFDPQVMPYHRRVWRPEWSSAPAGGGVTATVAQTLPKLGQFSTVGIRVGCTGAQTLPKLTQSATVGVEVSATADQTLPKLTQSATVGIRVAATADQTLPKLAQSASVDVATNEVNANAAQTLPKLTQSATVGIRVAATTIQTLPSLVQSANVDVRVGVTTAQTLPKLTQSVSVDVQTAEVNANVTQTLPKLTQAVNVDVATTGVTCAALQTLPKLGQAITVAIRVSATITQALPKLTGEAVEPARERLIVKSTGTRRIAYPHGKICYWRE